MGRPRWLIRLYPRAWRERYGVEFEALLEQQRPSARDTLDIILGALDAHLRAAGLTGMKEGIDRVFSRLRSMYRLGLLTFLLFVLSALLLNWMVDDSPFLAAMRESPSLNLAFKGVTAGSLLAGLAIAAGGSLVFWDVLNWAIARRRRDVMNLLIIPAAAFVLLACLALAIGSSGRGHVPGWVLGRIVQLTVILFLAVSGASLFAALSRSEVEPRSFVLFGKPVRQPYRLGALTAPVVAFGMALSTASAIAWGVMAGRIAPEVMGLSHLGMFHLSTMAIWIVSVALMAASTTAAGVLAKVGRGQ